MADNPFVPHYRRVLHSYRKHCLLEIRLLKPGTLSYEKLFRDMRDISRQLACEPQQLCVKVCLPNVRSYDDVALVLTALIYEVLSEQEADLAEFYSAMYIYIEAFTEKSQQCYTDFIEAFSSLVGKLVGDPLLKRGVDAIVKSDIAVDLATHVRRAISRDMAEALHEQRIIADDVVTKCLSVFHVFASHSKFESRRVPKLPHLEHNLWAMQAVVARLLRNQDLLRGQVLEKKIDLDTALIEALSAREDDRAIVRRTLDVDHINADLNQRVREEMMGVISTRLPNMSEVERRRVYSRLEHSLDVESHYTHLVEIVFNDLDEENARAWLDSSRSLKHFIASHFRSRTLLKVRNMFTPSNGEDMKFYTRINKIFSSKLNETQRASDVYRFMEATEKILVGFAPKPVVLKLVVDELWMRKMRSHEYSWRFFRCHPVLFTDAMKLLPQERAIALAHEIETLVPEVLRDVLLFQKIHTPDTMHYIQAYHGPAHAFNMYENAKRVLDAFDARQRLLPNHPGSTALYKTLVAIAAVAHDVYQHRGVTENEIASGRYIVNQLERKIVRLAHPLRQCFAAIKDYLAEFMEHLIVYGTTFNPRSSLTLIDVVNQLAMTFEFHLDAKERIRRGYCDPLTELGMLVLSKNDTRWPDFSQSAMAKDESWTRVATIFSQQFIKAEHPLKDCFGNYWKSSFSAKELDSTVMTLWASMLGQNIQMICEIESRSADVTRRAFAKFMYRLIHLSENEPLPWGRGEFSRVALEQIALSHMQAGGTFNIGEYKYSLIQYFECLYTATLSEERFARALSSKDYTQTISNYNQLVPKPFQVVDKVQCDTGGSLGNACELFAGLLMYIRWYYLDPILLRLYAGENVEEVVSEALFAFADMAAKSPLRLAMKGAAGFLECLKEDIVVINEKCQINEARLIAYKKENLGSDFSDKVERVRKGLSDFTPNLSQSKEAAFAKTLMELCARYVSDESSDVDEDSLNALYKILSKKGAERRLYRLLNKSKKTGFVFDFIRGITLYGSLRRASSEVQQLFEHAQRYYDVSNMNNKLFDEDMPSVVSEQMILNTPGQSILQC